MIRRFSHGLTTCLVVLAALLAAPASAVLPEMLNHQGRIAVEGVNFNGNGQFKFAFVNANGTSTYWSNDGSSVAGAEPAAAVTLAVGKGLYAVLLGDTALANMAAIPAGALEHEDVRLRVWFDDGVHGFQQITPDQRLAAVTFDPRGKGSRRRKLQRKSIRRCDRRAKRNGHRRCHGDRKTPHGIRLRHRSALGQ